MSFTNRKSFYLVLILFVSFFIFKRDKKYYSKLSLNRKKEIDLIVDQFFSYFKSPTPDTFEFIFANLRLQNSDLEFLAFQERFNFRAKFVFPLNLCTFSQYYKNDSFVTKEMILSINLTNDLLGMKTTLKK